MGGERRPGQGVDVLFHDPGGRPRRCSAARPRDFVGTQPELSGKRLLIVDDNATNRRILALQSGKWGMHSRDTESPEEALRWIDRAIRSTSRSSTCTCRRWTASRWRGRFASGARRCRWCCSARSAGARRAIADELFDAYLSKPIHQSQLFDTLVGLLAGDAAPKPAAAPAKARLDPEMATRHPLRILLAEDNVVNQKLALRILQQMGYRADLASNGLEAVESVERQTYDVVLMDVQMPEMDGLEATRQITAKWAPDSAPAHRRDDGQRDAGRPRDVPRGRHGRLPHQTHTRRPAGRDAQPRDGTRGAMTCPNPRSISPPTTS